MTADLPFSYPDAAPATANGAKGRRCARHRYKVAEMDHSTDPLTMVLGACVFCGKPYDPVRSRRGRNNRSRGNRAELAVARRYGGEKTGPLGQPEDIRGRDFRTQVKTHQGLPPARWRAIFAALDTQHDARLPRLIERYLPGQGIAADDYIVVRGSDWLLWFGKDE